MVAELRQARRNQRDLLELLCEAYDRLPDGPHRQVQTIGGIGPRTAAALVAKIVSIDRFVSPEKLVGYFGAFPEECSSGVDILGNPKAARHMHMSRKGNDLVRGLLWMAAQTAVRCNPAVRALFKRQLAAGKRGDVALGHCMRKLLHLVFAVWKTDRPFDPDHYPREGGQPRPRPDETPTSETPTSETPTSETPTSEGKRDGKRDGGAAGRKGPCPDRKAVTADAAASTPTLARAEPDAKPTAELRPAPAKVATADPADETSALDRSGNGASTGARSAPERPEVEDGSVGETPGPRLPSPRGGVEGPDRSGRPRAGKPSPSCRPRRAADGRRPD